jgi:hypothetical protein
MKRHVRPWIALEGGGGRHHRFAVRLSRKLAHPADDAWRMHLMFADGKPV